MRLSSSYSSPYPLMVTRFLASSFLILLLLIYQDGRNCGLIEATGVRGAGNMVGGEESCDDLCDMGTDPRGCRQCLFRSPLKFGKRAGFYPSETGSSLLADEISRPMIIRSVNGPPIHPPSIREFSSRPLDSPLTLDRLSKSLLAAKLNPRLIALLIDPNLADSKKGIHTQSNACPCKDERSNPMAYGSIGSEDRSHCDCNTD